MLVRAKRRPRRRLRLPGWPEAVRDGVTGTLVAPRDAPALEGALRAYLRDPALRQAHGRAGRERVLREFRPEAICEGIHREYLSLLRAKGVALPRGAPGPTPRAEPGESAGRAP